MKEKNKNIKKTLENKDFCQNGQQNIKIQI